MTATPNDAARVRRPLPPPSAALPVRVTVQLAYDDEIIMSIFNPSLVMLTEYGLKIIAPRKGGGEDRWQFPIADVVGYSVLRPQPGASA